MDIVSSLQTQTNFWLLFHAVENIQWHETKAENLSVFAGYGVSGLSKKIIITLIIYVLMTSQCHATSNLSDKLF